MLYLSLSVFLYLCGMAAGAVTTLLGVVSLRQRQRADTLLLTGAGALCAVAMGRCFLASGSPYACAQLPPSTLAAAGVLLGLQGYFIWFLLRRLRQPRTDAEGKE